jgi:erythrocyte membrane protein band 4.1
MASSTGPIDLDTSDDTLLTSNIVSGDIDDDSILEGEVVSSQTITSQSRTVETTTYTAERNGECETRVEQVMNSLK